MVLGHLLFVKPSSQHHEIKGKTKKHFFPIRNLHCNPLELGPLIVLQVDMTEQLTLSLTFILLIINFIAIKLAIKILKIFFMH